MPIRPVRTRRLTPSDLLGGHAHLLYETTLRPAPAHAGLHQGFREPRQRTSLETLERLRPEKLVLPHFRVKIGCLRADGCNVQFMLPPVGAGGAALCFQVRDGSLDTVQGSLGRQVRTTLMILSNASWGR